MLLRLWLACHGQTFQPVQSDIVFTVYRLRLISDKNITDHNPPAGGGEGERAGRPLQSLAATKREQREDSF